MTNNNVVFSPYKITWVEFFPLDGKSVTIHDQKALGAIFTHKGQKSFRRSFINKTSAKNFLDSFFKSLDKDYECYFFTDKQFGMAKESDGYAIPYTEKQKQESYSLFANPTDRLYDLVEQQGGFNNWHHWNYDEVTEWLMDNYNCPKRVAKEVAVLIK